MKFVGVYSDFYDGFTLIEGAQVGVVGKRVTGFVITLSSCKALCMGDPSCHGFDFEITGSQDDYECWLHDEASECKADALRAKECVTHGRKEGACGKKPSFCSLSYTL